MELTQARLDERHRAAAVAELRDILERDFLAGGEQNRLDALEKILIHFKDLLGDPRRRIGGRQALRLGSINRLDILFRHDSYHPDTPSHIRCLI